MAIVHDYLTQRGGAERVVLAMAQAFPDAPIYTSLYERDATFSEFVDRDVRASTLNALRPVRRHHRIGLPLFASVFRRMRIEADVALCSSSGWAHRVTVTGRKVVYCHNPARWLYQTDQYLRPGASIGRAALAPIRARLIGSDAVAAATASRYLANSSVVRGRVMAAYGIDAEVVPPPPSVGPGGAAMPVAGVEPGFFLCVSRLLPYKNVDAIVEGFALLPDQRLVVVGGGPDESRLRARASSNVRFLGVVTDTELRWLYESSTALVAASYEDYGLTPLEAAGFGKPSVVLRAGGFLDTMTDATATFFERPEAGLIASAVSAALDGAWDPRALRLRAALFGKDQFQRRLVDICEAVASAG